VLEVIGLDGNSHWLYLALGVLMAAGVAIAIIGLLTSAVLKKRDD
jgi:hypothetical protein